MAKLRQQGLIKGNMPGKQGIKSTWKICTDCQEEFLGLKTEQCLECRKRKYIKSNQYEYVEYAKKTK